ncbi:2Fe-2S iron-sulfur cluster-binding protein [Pleionea litopenaei]|uniref:2Fe-2S iron-sulfur cluster-binding protein n=1 Tax=Pleionea litopenaei TaxID=3070815 RepID=A0AA51X5Q5_9GAMM|nr:2Fe-2S iron-sulfur cluster-binding protein [Pleionea sp. HL-JVS1]WMS86258.1 2Fe-2S iron-sulfur cluster-binding protein [Pleionea sp. HL-JVS1]
MPLIKYVDHSGNEFEADVDVGKTVMEGAMDNMIDGILAECGGCCSCATCHVYVDEAFLPITGTAEGMEKEMLSAVNDPKPNSRLSCQIVVNDEMDGLRVEMPESQY